MDTELNGLQTTLGAEHAAVYVYGLLGSRTSQSAEAPLYDALRAAYEAHRERRDSLIGQISADGATPLPAAPAYTTPAGIDTPDGRFAAGLALEQGCARIYAALVGATTAERRAEAITWLNDAAARDLSFRGTPEIFPGADEYADR